MLSEVERLAVRHRLSLVGRGQQIAVARYTSARGATLANQANGIFSLSFEQRFRSGI